MSCAHRWAHNHMLPGRALEADVPRCAECGELAALDHVQAMNSLEERNRYVVDLERQVEELTRPPVIEDAPKSKASKSKGAAS